MDLEELDDLGLIPINPLPYWVWYQDMADFCETIGSDLARQRLARAIQCDPLADHAARQLNQRRVHADGLNGRKARSARPARWTRSA